MRAPLADPLQRSFDVSHDLRQVRAVRAALSVIADAQGFQKKKVRELTLALGEALDNALEHGCGPGGRVHVQFEVRADQIKVVVEDPGNGASCKPTFERANPEHNVNEELFRGRGLFLIRTVMDRVEAVELPKGGTRVVMVKFR